MIVTGAEGSDLLTAERSIPTRGRRTVVILLGVILATAVCSIVGATLIRGTWWYSDSTDQSLDEGSLARIELLTRGLGSSSAAAEAIGWLNAAADPNADPSAVWAYLIEAKSILSTSNEPALLEAAAEVEQVIMTIRAPFVVKAAEWVVDPQNESYPQPYGPDTDD